MNIIINNQTYYAVVEQRRNDQYRNRYDPENGKFEITQYKSLLFERNLVGVYGWLDGYGYPPNRHLDVIVITNNEYELGNKIEIKIIGIFIRNDNDNKLIAIESSRNENEITEIPISEQQMINTLYPKIDNGEGWFGKEIAYQNIEKYINGNN
jgi:inorganic pyrophosphatase